MNSRMKKKHLFALSLLAGVLLSIAWPLNGLPFFLFLAFVPLFFVDDYLLKNKNYLLVQIQEL